jgi:hypothetical protein
MYNPTSETLNLAKQALANGRREDGTLNKAVTVGTGLVFYDLQAPAKNLYPTITPLRNRIPRVKRPEGYGDSAKWKQILSLTGSGFDSMGWVPEGQRSGTMSYTSTLKTAAYMTIGEEDYVTFEARAAAKGFEDINATATMRLLQKMMRKEEMALLGGNGGGVALGTPATPTLAAAGSGATLPTLSPYSVIVVALTLEGWKNSSLAGGVATNKVITGADGQTFSLNGGSSNKSVNATQNVTLGQTLSATVTAIRGAVAYAWYVGAVGSETLQAITTINSATFSAPLTAGQAASSVTQDSSANSGLAFDGILTTAFNPANTAYVNSLATGTAGTGTTLTSSGRGSVVEIDTMMQSMWDNYRLSPTVLYMHSQQLKDVTTKVLGTGASSLLRYDAPAEGKTGYSPVAGGTIEFYFNPFGASGDNGDTGGIKMPVKVHPDLPPGTIIGWCEELPGWYQSNEVPNVAEVITREDYYRMDWPKRTRRDEYGVYAEEVLAVYAPFGLGVINNIAAG